MSETGHIELPDTFEERIERLERIVEQLEKGETPLEESLTLFEEGVRLAKACQAQIDDAKERVEELLESAEESGPPTRALETAGGEEG